MPYYMARSVSARLGAMPLDGTTSTEIITHRKTGKFEKLLQATKLLNEKPVPFPGDEGQHRLNWLGDAPFIQVQAFLNESGEKCLNPTKAPIRMRSGSVRVPKLMCTSQAPEPPKKSRPSFFMSTFQMGRISPVLAARRNPSRLKSSSTDSYVIAG